MCLGCIAKINGDKIPEIVNYSSNMIWHFDYKILNNDHNDMNFQNF